MFTGFARLRQSLTLLVFLRRISRSLHRANELAEARLRLEFPAAYKAGAASGPNLRRQPRLTELGVADVEALNKAWEENHPLSVARRDEQDEYNIT